jgi:hypothetical protein
MVYHYWKIVKWSEPKMRAYMSNINEFLPENLKIISTLLTNLSHPCYHLVYHSVGKILFLVYL